MKNCVSKEEEDPGDVREASPLCHAPPSDSTAGFDTVGFPL